ncbi:MAG: HEAT repeat domain-containing protein [Candidatus Omnitrophica bacterium]|nr:HEAT repeat domain-containing protein [Candidatus Omnitrophota bacterium]
MKKTLFLIVCLCIITAVANLVAAAPDLDPTRWDVLLKQIAAYQFGQSRTGLAAVAECVHAADPDPSARQALEQRLVAMLDSDATLDCKRFVCRQLNVIGSVQSVPSLASQLNNPDLADMARYALEVIPGKEAEAALLEALPSAAGLCKIGIINSLGNRRVSSAVEPLAHLLAGPDKNTAVAAITALKKIRGPAVIRILQDDLSQATALRPLLIDALLQCAEDRLAQGKSDRALAIYQQFYQPDMPTPVRAAALNGLLAIERQDGLWRLFEILDHPNDSLRSIASDHLRHLPGPGVTGAILNQWPKLDTNAQALVLAALGDRGDPSALPTAIAAVNASDQAVAVAALKSVGQLGGSDQVPLLAKFVTHSDAKTRTAAQTALSHLHGVTVDTAILGCVNHNSDQPTQIALINCLAARKAVAAFPDLIQLAAQASPQVQNSVYKALGNLAEERQLPILIDLLVHSSNQDTAKSAENALVNLCNRLDDKDSCASAILAGYGSAPAPIRCTLLRVLGQVGSARALPTLRDARNESDPKIQDAAIRALADWPDPAPSDELISIAKETSQLTHRVLAWRGFIRMAGMRIQKSPLAALKMYQQALELTPRLEEKKMVLSGLAKLPRSESLELIEPCWENPDLVPETSMAALKIAAAIASRHPEIAGKAMRHLLEVSHDDKLKKQADQILKKLPPGA